MNCNKMMAVPPNTACGRSASLTLRRLAHHPLGGNRSIIHNMRKPYKISASLVFIISLCLIPIGCNFATSFESLPADAKDLSILTDKPCKAPCWYNLVPDASTTQQVLDALSTLSFISASTIRVQDTNTWGPTPQESISATSIQANCRQPTKKECVEILIVEGKVKHMFVFPNYELTFEDVVNHFGNPDYVDANPWGVECMGCVIGFSWLQPSVSISRTDRRCSEGARLCTTIRNSGKIPRRLEVGMIAYLGSVPYYQRLPRQDFDFPWPGFEEP